MGSASSEWVRAAAWAGAARTCLNLHARSTHEWPVTLFREHLRSCIASYPVNSWCEVPPAAELPCKNALVAVELGEIRACSLVAVISPLLMLKGWYCVLLRFITRRFMVTWWEDVELDLYFRFEIVSSEPEVANIHEHFQTTHLRLSASRAQCCKPHLLQYGCRKLQESEERLQTLA